MKQAAKAIGWYLLLGIIWQALELIFYKEIQPRIVDDIMGILFFLFIYRAMEGQDDNSESKNNSFEDNYAED